jgi:hypothetical protein
MNSTVRNIDHQSARASPLEIFRERAEARCLLIANGYVELPDAVDELWSAAVRDGLVARHGVDEVQRVLSETFARWWRLE